MVIARLEQWPETDQAVLICSFENDKSAGEWFLTTHVGLYCRRNPSRLLHRYVEYGGPRPPCKWRFSSRGSSQMRSLIERAFRQNRWGVKIVPISVVYLPELPDSPRVAVHKHPYFSWCPTTNRNDFLQFKISSRPAEFSPPQSEMKGQLLNCWKDRDSDARFAWQWASLSRNAKIQMLTGYNGNMDELTHLMRKVLLSSGLLWRHAPRWHWRICIIPIQGRIYGNAPTKSLEAELKLLELWDSVFRAHFMPQAQPNLLQYHSCIEDDMRTLGQASVRQAPTAHEQLEAKLALREWLHNKATPPQIEQLLA